MHQNDRRFLSRMISNVDPMLIPLYESLLVDHFCLRKERRLNAWDQLRAGASDQVYITISRTYTGSFDDSHYLFRTRPIKGDKKKILFIGAHTLPSVSGSRSCPSEAWLASRAATSRRPHHLTCRLAQKE